MSIHVAFDFDSTITAAPGLLEPMMAALADAGHQVTILTGNQDIVRNAEKLGLTRYLLVSVSDKDIPDEKADWCQQNNVDLLIDNNSDNVKTVSLVTNAALFVAKQDNPAEESIRTFFVKGYYAYADDVTESTIVAYRAVLETVLTGAVRNPLEFAETQGSLQGIYHQIFVRRDRLWNKYDHRSARITKRLSLAVDPADIIYLIQTVGADEQHGKESYRAARDALAVALLNALHSVSGLANDALSLVSAAMAEGSAEGLTAAHALLSHQVNQKIDFSRVKELANKAAVNDPSFDAHANDGLHKLLGGLAGDLVHPIRTEIANGSNQDTLHQTVTDVIAAGVGFAFYLDNLIQHAYGVSQLEFYKRQGKATIDFITMGDRRVCPECVAAEASNPYPIADVPVPPLHGACRCFLSPN